MNRKEIPFEEAIKQRLYLDFGDGELNPAFMGDTDEPYYIYKFIEEYSKLKSAENVVNSTKSAFKPFIRGHRKKLFTEKEIEKMKNLKSQGTSNRRIAKIFSCDEKTIRNYLHSATG